MDEGQVWRYACPVCKGREYLKNIMEEDDKSVEKGVGNKLKQALVKGFSKKNGDKHE